VVGHSESMRLRSMLVLTWLIFAGLATAAGFAAVGLVGQGLTVAAAPENGPSVSATSTATRTTTTTVKPNAKPAAKPRKTTQKPTTATPRTRKPTTAAPVVQRTGSRSVRGNYVSATCSGASVTLSASPAPGWRLDEYRPGPARDALAKFHSNHDEVKIEVSCSGGSPVFKIED
jgi:hypothetical protein